MENDEAHTKQAYNNNAGEYLKKVHGVMPANEHIEIPGIKPFLKELEGKDVLDVGCGSGRHTELLLEAGAKAQAVDLSEEMITVMKKNFPTVPSQAGSMTALPYPDESFDALVYGLSIHYLEDIAAIYKEAYRVLRPGGIIIVSTNNPCTNGQRKIELDGKETYIVEDYYREGYTEWEMLPGMHIRTYNRTISHLFNPLFAAGFSLQEISEPKPLPELEPVDHAMYAKTLKRPYFIIFKAQKVA